ncbi:hypothetical protein [Thermocoleostomius sinensis]|uniref:Lipoprotein n=1 Tax=Thermocoleostomius sinensis A174 TaxID=2016057 RepID=A0A9E9CAR1_9CYAN|nr:hypothetical protein [Thermocoleostomius sinensis]WAL59255.1 hypothetical protein OXH18_19070 [Thermocoleostomius sinensis A174]
MIKRSRGLTVILTATALIGLVGCSQPETTTRTDAIDTNDSIAQSVDEDAAADPDPESAEDYRVVENIALPEPGPDPLAMAFQLRQFSGELVGSEQLKVTYSAPDRAVVESVVRGLPDDSVRAIRTRYEFEPVASTQGQPTWQLVRVTQQNKCQPGRGSDEWTADLCQ